MSKILSLLGLAWPYLKKYRFRLAIAVFAGVLFGISNASFLWATKTMFSRIVPHQSPDTVDSSPYTGFTATTGSPFEQNVDAVLDPYLPAKGHPLTWKNILGGILFFPILVFLRGSLSYLSNYLMSWVSVRFTSDLRGKLLEHFQNLGPRFYQSHSVADLAQGMGSDISTFYEATKNVFSDLVKEPITLIMVLVASLAIDWKLTLFAFLLLPVVAWPVTYLGKKLKGASQGMIAAQVQQASLVIESLQGIRLIQAYGLERFTTWRFNQQAQKLIYYSTKQAQADSLVNPCVELITNFALGGFLFYIIVSDVSFANMAAVLAGALLFFSPIRRLSKVNITLKQGMVSAHRLQNFLNVKPEIIVPVSASLISGFTHEIQFKRLVFRYTTTPVIQDLDLVIRCNTSLGLVGESGSGKSTLTNLLLRFYDPESGSIQIDGRDIREFDLKSYRRLFAYVSQDTVLFNLSVAENIACGEKHLDLEAVKKAAKAAHAYDFIQELPNKFEANLGERASTLSGGQRQRLALARALYRQAPVLVLDEATSNLDANSEGEILRAIDKIRGRCTIVSVAHRLATLRNFDKLAFMANGQITATGTFDELLKSEPRFGSLARQQGLS